MKYVKRVIAGSLFALLLVLLPAVRADDPEYLKPYKIDFEKLTDEEQIAYQKLWETWNKVLQNSAVTEMEADEQIKDWKKSGNTIIKAFVPLLEGLKLKVNGEYDKAEKKFYQCLRENPKELQANLELGTLFLDMRQMDKAKMHLTRFLNGIDPEKVDSTMANDLLMSFIHLSRLAVMDGDEATNKKMLDLAIKVPTEDAKKTVAEMKVSDLVRTKGPNKWVLEGEEQNAWKVETANYNILTNVDKKFCEMLGKHAEAVRKIFVKDFKFLGKPSERKNTIIVFSSRSEFERFNMSLNGHPMSGVAGYFDTMSKFLVLWNDQAKSNSYTTTGEDFPEVLKTMYHEMNHQFLDHWYGEYPDWFSEGIASMYENIKVKGKSGKMLSNCQFHLEIVRDLAQGTDFYGAGKFQTLDEVVANNASTGMDYGYCCIMQFYMRKKKKKSVQKMFEMMQKGVLDDKRLLEVVYGKSKKNTEANWKKFCSTMHR